MDGWNGWIHGWMYQDWKEKLVGSKMWKGDL